jgi:aminoglycoside phosphotransferase family enzyme/predicted kinase
MTVAAGSAPAAAVETHISVLFFVGDRAYKLKKPVRFDFLDFSTRAQREAMCHREVELNRRLAPDVYLGVIDVLGVDGATCDHLVVMRRMPDARRLSTLVVQQREEVTERLREVAKVLAAFHEHADRNAAIDAVGTPEAVARRWDENFAEMERFVGPVFDPTAFERARGQSTRFIAGRAPLFAGRIADGRLCDGHGDLQAGDVFCLDDGPRILDCIEFDDDLRYGDVLDDVAFLAMDLERLGAPGPARRFVSFYEEMSGHVLPATLLHLAIAYRAQVRAKVAALRWSQEDPDTPEAVAVRDEARQLFDLCLAHLEHTLVRLYLVGGLPGTGKTTLARGLGERLDLTVLRSDEERKEIAGLSPTTPAASELNEGIYGADFTGQVYRELLAKAGALLGRGESVVLDASWTRHEHRLDARTLAAATSAEIVELRCALDPDVAAARIERRLARGGDASDATPAIALAMAAGADGWPEATTIATDDPPGIVLDRYLRSRDDRPAAPPA